MRKRSAIKHDLFAPHQRAEEIDHLGDPLAQIEACIDIKALAAEIDRVALRAPSLKFRALCTVKRFDYHGNMETKEMVIALTALAQSSRLVMFRLLVQAGEEGMPAGKIAEALEIPPSSLSFHLKELLYAGLIKSKQEGRFVIYSANYERMEAVIGYLTENCCNGKPC